MASSRTAVSCCDVRMAGVTLNRSGSLYMNRQQKEYELIRRFLLGDLEEGRREQLEERLLTDAELQEQVSETRIALIDEYAFGLLDGRELELFESNFRHAPEQSHELRVSKALRKYVETNPDIAPAGEVRIEPTGGTRFSRWWRAAAAAAAAALIVVAAYGGWMVYRNRQLAAQFERLRNQRLKVEQELAVLNRPDHPAAGDPSVISLSLVSGIERSEDDDRRVEESRVIVTEGKNFLLLRLPLDKDGSNSYRVVIQTDEGADIYTVNALKARADGGRRAVDLVLPARLLPTGNYQAKLVGDTTPEPEAVTYPFQVVQK